MKKILLTVALTAGLVFSSCDMDTMPQGVQTDKDGVSTYIDCEAARLGVYSGMRSFGTGAYIYLTELQMDMFIGTLTNGNRNGEIARGQIYANNQDIEAVWGNIYSRIGNVNFFIAKAQALLDGGTLTDRETANVNGFIGEAKFARAMYYLYLFDHYCQSYTEAKAEQPALGLPLITKYDPMPNRKEYPGRSTMKATIELINTDLEEAFDALVDWEAAGNTSSIAQNSAFVSSYTVSALQARAALLSGDWQTAIDKADDVISAGTWTLTPYAQYPALWSSDQGTELIFRPYIASVGDAEAGGISATGSAWLQASMTECDYLPSYMNCVTMYDLSTVEVGGQEYPKDIRANAFFNVWTLVYHGSESPAYVFNKYPGNSIFNSYRQVYKNMPKLFRLSELYLIKAEAAYELGDEDTANEALNDLRTARIFQYTAEDYTGDELRDQIREERTKELMGEGFRMSDLRRWGLGFKRNPAYPISSSVVRLFGSIEKDLEYAPGYFRFVWPIPQGEMDVNPQLKGQQNPGYE